MCCVFFVARHGKTAVKRLKDAVLDFYTVEDICCAKENMLDAVESFKSELNLPHIPLRRDGELRAVKSLDDIFTVLTCLDENLKLECLPKYVSDSPDSMPSIRIYDGDLLTLMAAFDKLKERMCNAEAALSAILQAVNMTKDMLSTPAVHTAYTLSGAAQLSQPDINNVWPALTTGNAQASETDSTVMGNSRQSLSVTSRDWATSVAAASSPGPASALAMSSNMFSVLRHLDDGDEGSDGQNDAPFVEQHSRRAAKRRRQQSRQQQQRSSQEQQRQ